MRISLVVSPEELRQIDAYWKNVLPGARDRSAVIRQLILTHPTLIEVCQAYEVAAQEFLQEDMTPEEGEELDEDPLKGFWD